MTRPPVPGAENAGLAAEPTVLREAVYRVVQDEMSPVVRGLDAWMQERDRDQVETLLVLTDWLDARRREDAVALALAVADTRRDLWDARETLREMTGRADARLEER